MFGKKLLERNKFHQKDLILIHSIVSSDSNVILHLPSTGNDYRNWKSSSNYFYLVVVENDITTVESLRLDLSTVKEATNNFSIHNKIGEGGFGEVYKV